ncbi:nitrate reductase molybdenum cofactor assembly chaperone [Aquibacillus sediminis]|uniref:nitrate reductase molybdenum cofactor assembly chaperone n=1 Tax=Aquibacillus sediminis TaxID=2574734 RepID=UPI0011084A70|nr:nitrate reductase molybdenum cofactor assembly chaperone [Aquibacillus sediminis]
MKAYQTDLLMIASRMFSYPDGQDNQAVLDCAEHMVASTEMKQEVRDAIDTVYRIPLKQLQETYVDTFDLKSKVGLYLSAHEFGDSPKRGAALIKLQKMINEAGYDRVDGELADYLPMLFEFVAVEDDFKGRERLLKRMSCVTQRILNHFPEENPYYPFLSLMMKYVFEAPTEEELQKMDQDREEADLEELPYPIMYN